MRKSEFIRKKALELREKDKATLKKLKKQLNSAKTQLRRLLRFNTQLVGKTKKKYKEMLYEFCRKNVHAVRVYKKDCSDIENIASKLRTHIGFLEKEINTLSSRDMKYYREKAEKTYCREGVFCTEHKEPSRAILFPELHKDFILLENFGAEDPGTKWDANRWWANWFEIIDRGTLNGKPAWLFEVGWVAYYHQRIWGKGSKRYLAGYDDGHLFLTQVFSTADTIEEAVDKLIPKKVKEALKKGTLHVKRWGDIWFVEVKGKKIPEKLKEITIRRDHKVLGWKEGRNIYAVKCLAHPEHPLPRLKKNTVYLVLRNKTVSRTRVYD